MCTKIIGAAGVTTITITGIHADIIIIDDAKKSMKEVEPYMLKNPKDFRCVELPRESFKRNKAGQMPSKFGKQKRG